MNLNDLIWIFYLYFFSFQLKFFSFFHFYLNLIDFFSNWFLFELSNFELNWIFFKFSLKFHCFIWIFLKNLLVSLFYLNFFKNLNLNDLIRLIKLMFLCCFANWLNWLVLFDGFANPWPALVNSHWFNSLINWLSCCWLSWLLF